MQDERRSQETWPIRLHRAYGGKIQTLPKVPMASFDEVAVWYTPGVADACRAIATDPDAVWSLTNRANSVAVLSDGSRVLGLGDIGPEAGLPVMEGKALLLKYFGGVDGVPLCVGTHTVDGIVAAARAVAPSFGGINLEDIAQPKCFRVLAALREDTGIPVWHDDQQGTAMVALAGLRNALRIVGKDLHAVRIALVGIGAANTAVYNLLRAEGVEGRQVIACDSVGTLHAGRADIEGKANLLTEKWAICSETNAERVSGGIEAALNGADVCLAFSKPGPDTIRPEWIGRMASDAIVFACANPVPEIDPTAALRAGARLVATGRSDFPNQVNNSLAFPGVFRGALDVRARMITHPMARAGAAALSEAVPERSLGERSILPRTDDIHIAARVAAAVGSAALSEGLARIELSKAELFEGAVRRIEAARAATHALVETGHIAALPENR